jgi:release factor glutamine methyltransferase
VRDHEPGVALIAETDPLLFYKAISKHAAGNLNHRGILCFEVGIGQADEVSKVIESYLPSATISIINDITHIPRIVIGELQ